jgi:hypothetical protein
VIRRRLGCRAGFDGRHRRVRETCSPATPASTWIALGPRTLQDELSWTQGTPSHQTDIWTSLRPGCRLRSGVKPKRLQDPPVVVIACTPPLPARYTFDPSGIFSPSCRCREVASHSRLTTAGQTVCVFGEGKKNKKTRIGRIPECRTVVESLPW